MTRSRRSIVFTAVTGVVLLAGFAGARATSASTPAGLAGAAAPARPNVVFVLTDDLSGNLVRYLPQVRKLQADGLTFTDCSPTAARTVASTSSTTKARRRRPSPRRFRPTGTGPR
jgi:hypothetical protein